MAEVNQSDGKRMRIKLDMTPMVDLAFLLLTFFILTTSLISQEVMEIRMPDKEDSKTKQPVVNVKRVVTLILGADDKIYWYKGEDAAVRVTDYSSSGVRPVLIELNNSIKDMVLLVKPTDESRYQNLVDILDEISICSIRQYYLVDTTPEDLQLVKSYTMK